jgi:glycerol-3-phosphate dehydrogenase
VPQTEDNRVLFMVPWHDRLLVGTTDTLTKDTPLEPKPLKEEVEFLLKHAAHYLKKAPTKNDILSIFTGLRPLIKGSTEGNTAALSRDHTIIIAPSGLITIAGGKWTTYRKMAEDVINKAIPVGALPERPCITKNLRLYGWKENHDPLDHSSLYGSEDKALKGEIKKNPKLKEKIHPDFPYLWVEVLWAIKEEMARSVEDVLSRRTRALLLGAKASMEIAPDIAKFMRKELKYDENWEKAQIDSFLKLAKNYTI